MANTIQLKRSSTASDTPSASDLAVGELAVNTADAKIFTKHTDGSVVELGPLAGGTFTGDVTLTDTDAGSGVGPQISLFRNSASPADNDLLGRVAFQGENDAGQLFAYAAITGKLLDNTDGTEDGGLVFSVGQAGTALMNRISLQGYGDTVFSNKNVRLNTGVNLKFEGATENTNETTLTVADPTADRTITLPDTTGTVALTSDIPSSGISSGNVATFTSGAADNDFLRIDGTSIEGRSASEVLSDIEAMPLAGGTFTGDVILTDTDSGASEGPLLTLRRDSSSPADNDVLGHIKFKGDNDAGENVFYAGINAKINDNTDGTEDGLLDLSVMANGTVAAPRIRIQGNGDTIFLNRDVRFNTDVDLKFEGATSNDHETTLTVTDPTADRTITLPDATGTVALTSDLGTIASQAADSVNIDGGAIDGVTIGTNSVVTDLRVDNLKIDGNQLSSTGSSGAQRDIYIQPNGGGTLQLMSHNILVGDINTDVTLSSYGTGDLTLNTNSGTNSGSLVIADGANGNISLTPDGTGVVQIDGSNGVSIESGVVSVKNGGTQSEVRLYCESSNAHYAALKAPAHADFAGNVTSTLPSVTGTLIGTANADAPATVSSSAEVDHVLVNDGGVLKKATVGNLGISGGGSSLTIQDEGNALTTAATTLNFVGAGVEATGTGATKTITIGETSNADTVDNKHVSVLSQSAYNALTPDGNTIYFITG